MKNSFLIGLFIFYNCITALAQCLVTPQFQVSGAACPDLPITITNTSVSSGTSGYTWDFCPGDLVQTPSGSVTGTFPNAIGNSLGIDEVFDGTDYYAFIANSGAPGIGRFYFGNSLQNLPVADYMSGITGIGFNSKDLKIVKVGTDWHVFTCGGNDVQRIDFGSSLSNPNPVATVLATGGALNTPYSMDFADDNGHYYIMVANSGASPGSVSVIDLGTNILNATPTVTSHTITGIAQSVCAVKSCDKWYGFVANFATNAISRIDFNSSLSNPAPLITDITIGGLPITREIEMKHDDGKWFAFLIDVNGSQLSRVEFGIDITNLTPALTSLGNLNGLLAANYGFTIKKYGSRWMGITDDYSTAVVKQYSFPDLCSSLPVSISTDSVPPVISFSTGGWHHIELSMLNNGGTSLFSDSIFVSPYPIPAFQVSSACIDRTTQFTNLTSISSGSITNWYWNFDDGATDTVYSPSHNYGAVNNYIVTLTATSDAGCVDSVKDTITINLNPLAQFTSTGNLCADYLIPFQDSSIDSAGTISNWFWDFDDQVTDTLASPQHSFSNAGMYNVSLIVTSTTGCKDTTSTTIAVLPTPQSAFSTFNTCIGETALFTNQTTISDSSTLSYLWEFGDTDTSNFLNPVHSYPTVVANYNVLLIAQSVGGCIDTSMQIVHIGNKPLPWFTFSPNTACAGNTISFTDSSFIQSGDTITDLYWDFGDNTYDSINKNPVHVYQTSGFYTITLTAHSPASCDSTITRQVYVIASPQANFITNNVCFGNGSLFTDLSQAPTGSTVVGWEWSFGDSTTNSLNQNPTHNYSQYGSYTATLQVTSSSGCIDTFSQQVLVYALPQVAFTNTTGCSGNAVIFTDQSTVVADTITVWKWNFGDASVINSLQNPSHIYSAASSYSVKLVATSSHGCLDSLSKNILVYASPDFTIGLSATCFGSPTQFNYIPITINPVVTTSWDFGDSTFAAQANPIHTYSNVDTFNVTLTVTDGLTTCPTTHNASLLVHPIPNADFTSTEYCTNRNLQLFDNSVISAGTLTNWNWFVNDSAIATTANAFIGLSTAATYNIKLQVISDAGCTDSITQSITIHTPTVPQFSVTPNYGVPGIPSSFLNTAQGIITLNWNFGDNTAHGFDTLVMHTYQDTGFYVITLIATNTYGCVDTITKTYGVLIPLLDIGVINVTTKQNGNLLAVTATLINAGNIDIHSTELKATIEGLSVIHEFPLIEIPTSSPVKTYTFAANIEVNSNELPAYICVEALNPNNQTDLNSSNNIHCKELLTEFTFINVTPNPSSALAQINVNMPAKGLVGYTVSDGLGKIMAQQIDVPVLKGYNAINLEVSSWSKGMYEIRVNYLDTYKALKFMRE